MARLFVRLLVFSTSLFGLGCSRDRVVNAVGESDASRAAVLFSDDFESCDFGKYKDRFANRIVNQPVHSGRCASKIGAGVSAGGKLLVRVKGSDDVWFRAWVYFPEGLPSRCCAQFESGTEAGFHYWRYYSHFDGNSTLHFDFNTPSGASGIQLAMFSELAADTVIGGNYDPASSASTGRWQCWETRVKLNSPGKSDGIMEFWVDGTRYALATGLNNRGTSTEQFGYVDVQSNIGGGPHPSVWPESYWWVIDDVVVSRTRFGCEGMP